jgi:hypothetical protein
MGDPTELELIFRAILSTTTGDCEWLDKEARRVRDDPALKGLRPGAIKDLLQEYVVNNGMQVIKQIPETRGYDRAYYYKVIVPVDEFKLGLFVELVLADDDPDAPAVRIVNAHEQKR